MAHRPVLFVFAASFLVLFSVSSAMTADFNADEILLRTGDTQYFSATLVNTENLTKTFPIHVSGTGNLEHWVWFAEGNTIIRPVDINVTLTPFEEKIIRIGIFAGIVGNYDIMLCPNSTDQYDNMTLRVIPAKENFFDVPGISMISLLFLLITSAAIASQRQ